MQVFVGFLQFSVICAGCYVAEEFNPFEFLYHHFTKLPKMV